MVLKLTLNSVRLLNLWCHILNLKHNGRIGRYTLLHNIEALQHESIKTSILEHHTSIRTEQHEDQWRCQTGIITRPGWVRTAWWMFCVTKPVRGGDRPVYSASLQALHSLHCVFAEHWVICITRSTSSSCYEIVWHKNVVVMMNASCYETMDKIKISVIMKSMPNLLQFLIQSPSQIPV